MPGTPAPLSIRKQRHQAALEMLAQGESFSTAVSRISADWGVGRRMARIYVNRALDELVQDCEAIDHKALLADTIARYQRLAARAEAAGQYASAVGATNGLAGLILVPKMNRGSAPPHMHHG